MATTPRDPNEFIASNFTDPRTREILADEIATEQANLRARQAQWRELRTVIAAAAEKRREIEASQRRAKAEAQRIAEEAQRKRNANLEQEGWDIDRPTQLLDTGVRTWRESEEAWAARKDAEEAKALIDARKAREAAAEEARKPFAIEADSLKRDAAAVAREREFEMGKTPLMTDKQREDALAELKKHDDPDQRPWAWRLQQEREVEVKKHLIERAGPDLKARKKILKSPLDATTFDDETKQWAREKFPETFAEEDAIRAKIASDDAIRKRKADWDKREYDLRTAAEAAEDKAKGTEPVKPFATSLDKGVAAGDFDIRAQGIRQRQDELRSRAAKLDRTRDELFTKIDHEWWMKRAEPLTLEQRLAGETAADRKRRKVEAWHITERQKLQAEEREMQLDWEDYERDWDKFKAVPIAGAQPVTAQPAAAETLAAPEGVKEGSRLETEAYIAQPGDTRASVAAKFGITEDKLEEFNRGLSGKLIAKGNRYMPGEKLLIPKAEPAAPPATPPKADSKAIAQEVPEPDQARVAVEIEDIKKRREQFQQKEAEIIDRARQARVSGATPEDAIARGNAELQELGKVQKELEAELNSTANDLLNRAFRGEISVAEVKTKWAAMGITTDPEAEIAKAKADQETRKAKLDAANQALNAYLKNPKKGDRGRLAAALKEAGIEKPVEEVVAAAKATIESVAPKIPEKRRIEIDAAAKRMVAEMSDLYRRGTDVYTAEPFWAKWTDQAEGLTPEEKDYLFREIAKAPKARHMGALKQWWAAAVRSGRENALQGAGGALDAIATLDELVGGPASQPLRKQQQRLKTFQDLSKAYEQGPGRLNMDIELPDRDTFWSWDQLQRAPIASAELTGYMATFVGKAGKALNVLSFAKEEFDAIAEMESRTGEKVNPVAKLGVATITGVANVGIELIGGAFGKLRPLSGRFGTQMIKNDVRRFLWRALLGGAEEVGEEGLQQISGRFLEDISRSVGIPMPEREIAGLAGYGNDLVELTKTLPEWGPSVVMLGGIDAMGRHLEGKKARYTEDQVARAMGALGEGLQGFTPEILVVAGIEPGAADRILQIGAPEVRLAEFMRAYGERDPDQEPAQMLARDLADRRETMMSTLAGTTEMARANETLIQMHQPVRLAQELGIDQTQAQQVVAAMGPSSPRLAEAQKQAAGLLSMAAGWMPGMGRVTTQMMEAIRAMPAAFIEDAKAMWGALAQVPEAQQMAQEDVARVMQPDPATGQVSPDAQAQAEQIAGRVPRATAVAKIAGGLDPLAEPGRFTADEQAQFAAILAPDSAQMGGPIVTQAALDEARGVLPGISGLNLQDESVARAALQQRAQQQEAQQQVAPQSQPQAPGVAPQESAPQPQAARSQPQPEQRAAVPITTGEAVAPQIDRIIGEITGTTPADDQTRAVLESMKRPIADYLVGPYEVRMLTSAEYARSDPKSSVRSPGARFWIDKAGKWRLDLSPERIAREALKNLRPDVTLEELSRAIVRHEVIHAVLLKVFGVAKLRALWRAAPERLRRGTMMLYLRSPLLVEIAQQREDAGWTKEQREKAPSDAEIDAALATVVGQRFSGEDGEYRAGQEMMQLVLAGKLKYATIESLTTERGEKGSFVARLWEMLRDFKKWVAEHLGLFEEGPLKVDLEEGLANAETLMGMIEKRSKAVAERLTKGDPQQAAKPGKGAPAAPNAPPVRPARPGEWNPAAFWSRPELMDAKGMIGALRQQLSVASHRAIANAVAKAWNAATKADRRQPVRLLLRAVAETGPIDTILGSIKLWPSEIGFLFEIANTPEAIDALGENLKAMVGKSKGLGNYAKPLNPLGTKERTDFPDNAAYVDHVVEAQKARSRTSQPLSMPDQTVDNAGNQPDNPSWNTPSLDKPAPFANATASDQPASSGTAPKPSSISTTTPALETTPSGPNTGRPPQKSRLAERLPEFLRKLLPSGSFWLTDAEIPEGDAVIAPTRFYEGEHTAAPGDMPAVLADAMSAIAWGGKTDALESRLQIFQVVFASGKRTTSKVLPDRPDVLQIKMTAKSRPSDVVGALWPVMRKGVKKAIADVLRELVTMANIQRLFYEDRHGGITEQIDVDVMQWDAVLAEKKRSRRYFAIVRTPAGQEAKLSLEGIQKLKRKGDIGLRVGRLSEAARTLLGTTWIDPRATTALYGKAITERIYSAIWEERSLTDAELRRLAEGLDKVEDTNPASEQVEGALQAGDIPSLSDRAEAARRVDLNDSGFRRMLADEGLIDDENEFIDPEDAGKYVPEWERYMERFDEPLSAGEMPEKAEEHARSMLVGGINPLVGETFDEGDPVPLHNAKVEVLTKLEDEGVLGGSLLEDATVDFSYAMEALERIGDKRDLDEIAQDHEDDTERTEFSTRKPVFEHVVDQWGTTRNWRETGYLLPDGRQVRLSYNRNQRDADHREVSWPGSPTELTRSPGTGTLKMLALMNAGAIRIQGNGQGGLSMRRAPTPEQIRKLAEYFVDAGEIVADIEAPHANGYDEVARETFQGSDAEMDAFFKKVKRFYSKNRLDDQPGRSETLSAGEMPENLDEVLPPGTKRRDIWDLAQAGRTNAQIAEALSATPEAIESALRSIRNRLGVPAQLGPRRPVDPDRLSPQMRQVFDAYQAGESREATARRLGIKLPALAKLFHQIRQRMGGEIIPFASPGRTKYDWAAIDWTQSNAAIARQLGTDHSTVRDARKRRASAPPERQQASPPDAMGLPPRLRQVYDLFQEGKGANEIAQELGVSPKNVSTAIAALRKRGALPPNATLARVQSIDWEQVDWSKNDAQLAEDLDVSRPTVLRRRREYAPGTQHASGGYRGADQMDARERPATRSSQPDYPSAQDALAHIAPPVGNEEDWRGGAEEEMDWRVANRGLAQADAAQERRAEEVEDMLLRVSERARRAVQAFYDEDQPIPDSVISELREAIQQRRQALQAGSGTALSAGEMPEQDGLQTTGNTVDLSHGYPRSLQEGTARPPKGSALSAAAFLAGGAPIHEIGSRSIGRTREIVSRSGSKLRSWAVQNDRWADRYDRNVDPVKDAGGREHVVFRRADGKWDKYTYESIDVPGYGMTGRIVIESDGSVDVALRGATQAEYFAKLAMFNHFYPEVAYDVVAVTPEGVHVRQADVGGRELAGEDELANLLSNAGWQQVYPDNFGVWYHPGHRVYMLDAGSTNGRVIGEGDDAFYQPFDVTIIPALDAGEEEKRLAAGELPMSRIREAGRIDLEAPGFRRILADRGLAAEDEEIDPEDADKYLPEWREYLAEFEVPLQAGDLPKGPEVDGTGGRDQNRGTNSDPAARGEDSAPGSQAEKAREQIVKDYEERVKKADADARKEILASESHQERVLDEDGDVDQFEGYYWTTGEGRYGIGASYLPDANGEGTLYDHQGNEIYMPKGLRSLEDAREEAVNYLMRERTPTEVTYANEDAVNALVNSLQVPAPLELKEAFPTKWGSYYFMVRKPTGWENGEPVDWKTYKLSIRDHEPSPFREKEFGTVTQYWEANTKDPQSLSQAISKMEVWLRRKADLSERSAPDQPGRSEPLRAGEMPEGPVTPEQDARHAELEAKHNAGTITPEETAEAQRLVDEAAKAARRIPLDAFGNPEPQGSISGVGFGWGGKPNPSWGQPYPTGAWFSLASTSDWRGAIKERVMGFEPEDTQKAFDAALRQAQAKGYEIVSRDRDLTGIPRASLMHTQAARMRGEMEARRSENKRNLIAKILAEGTKTFLRYGKPSESGQSWNAKDGFAEVGISVYPAFRLKDGSYVITLDNMDLVSSMFIHEKGGAVYEVHGGDTVGVGSDGEPLIKGGKYRRLGSDAKISVLPSMKVPEAVKGENGKTGEVNPRSALNSFQSASGELVAPGEVRQIRPSDTAPESGFSHTETSESAQGTRTIGAADDSVNFQPFTGVPLSQRFNPESPSILSAGEMPDAPEPTREEFLAAVQKLRRSDDPAIADLKGDVAMVGPRALFENRDPSVRAIVAWARGEAPAVPEPDAFDRRAQELLDKPNAARRLLAMPEDELRELARRFAQDPAKTEALLELVKDPAAKRRAEDILYRTFPGYLEEQGEQMLKAGEMPESAPSSPNAGLSKGSSPFAAATDRDREESRAQAALSPMQRFERVKDRVAQVAPGLGLERTEALRVAARELAGDWDPALGSIDQRVGDALFRVAASRALETEGILSMPDQGPIDVPGAPTNDPLSTPEGQQGKPPISDEDRERRSIAASYGHMRRALKQIQNTIGDWDGISDPRAWMDQFDAAMAEEEGQRTIGQNNAEYANPGRNEWTRRAVDVSLHAYRENLTHEDFAEWDQQARELIASMRGETLVKRLTDKVMRGDVLDRVETRAAMMLSHDMWTTALSSGDPRKITEAQQWTWVYATNRTAAARSLAAGRDMTRTPTQRAAAFVGQQVSRLSPEDEHAIQKITNPEERQKAVAAKQAEAWGRIEGAMSLAGISMQDLFLSDAVQALRRSEEMRGAIRTVSEQFSGTPTAQKRARQALEMLVDGWRPGDITRTLKLPRRSVEMLQRDLREQITADLGELVSRRVLNGLADFGRPGAVSMPSLTERERRAQIAAQRKEQIKQLKAEDKAKVEAMVNAALGWADVNAAHTIRLVRTGEGLSGRGSYRFDPESAAHITTVSRLIQTVNSNGYDVFIEALKAELLTGMITNTINATSAPFMAAYEWGIHRALTALVNAALFRNPDMAQFGELNHLFQALFRGIGPAVQRARLAWNIEHSLYEEEKLGQAIDLEKLVEHGPGRVAMSDQLWAQIFGGKAYQDYARERMAILETGAPVDVASAAARLKLQNHPAFKAQALADKFLGSWMGIFYPLKGRAVRWGLRLNGFFDALYNELFWNVEIGAQAYRIARRNILGQAVAKGLTGKALNDDVKRMSAEMVDSQIDPGPGLAPHLTRSAAADAAKQRGLASGSYTIQQVDGPIGVGGFIVMTRMPQLQAIIAEQMSRQGSEAAFRAVEETRRMTLTRELKSEAEGGSRPEQMMSGLIRWRGRRAATTQGKAGQALLQVIFKFLNTPYQVFEHALRTTPVINTIGVLPRLAAGLTSYSKKQGFFTAYPQDVVARDIVDHIVSTGIAFALMSFVEGDDDDDDKMILITGTRSRGTDKLGETMLNKRTEGPMMIRIGPAANPLARLDYSRIDPFGSFMAATTDIVRSGKRLRDGAELGIEASKLSAVLLNRMQSQPMLSSTSDVVDILYSLKAQDGRLWEKLHNFVRRNVTPLVLTNFFRQGLRSLDDYQRDTYDQPAWKKWAYDVIPHGGLWGIEPSIDMWGNPVTKQLTGTPAKYARLLIDVGLQPSLASKHRFDRFMQEFGRIHASQALPRGLSVPAGTGIETYLDLDNPKADQNGEVKMTPKQKADFRRRVGTVAAARMAPRVTARDLTYPTEERFRELVAELGKIDNEVRGQMFPSDRRWREYSPEERRAELRKRKR